MDRLLIGLAALLTWAVSSPILYVVCLLSVSETIISAAMVIIGACLIASAIALAFKRNGLAIVIAAGPGIAVAVIFGASMAVGKLFSP